MKEARRKREPCQYYYSDLACVTFPDSRVGLPLRKMWWRLKRCVWNTSILGILGYGSRTLRAQMKTRQPLFQPKRETAPGLKEGDLVRVRSLKEIFGTLDNQDKLLGLRFTPEMAKFCGKTFKAYKRIDKIIIETTGELRKIKTPTVLLEGVFCDGKAHGGCDRSCFCFWREVWLEKIIAPRPEIGRTDP